MKLTLIIPCFNEEAVLDELFSRVTQSSESWECEWTALCVDDGSSDHTWEMIQSQGIKDPRWGGIRFSRNFGHQAAVSAGLAHASDADLVAVMDADLQDPPEELYRFLKKWKEGYQVVYAIRHHRKESCLKRAAYWLFYRLLKKMSTIPIPLDSGDFCVMDGRVVRTIVSMPERNRFVRGLRAYAGYRQIGITYERAPRSSGKPKYTFGKLLALAADGVFNFSGIPLRLASHLGLWVSFFAISAATFTLLQRLFRSHFAEIGLGPVPGFATIVIGIFFLGGVQLICLGIVGEYLVRIFEEVKQRPPWIVSEATEKKEKERIEKPTPESAV